jgi:hypothetical protein
MKVKGGRRRFLTEFGPISGGGSVAEVSLRALERLP